MHRLLFAAELAILAAPLLAAAVDLRPVEDRRSVKLTTIGRRSHEPRTVTVWFVHERGRVYVQAGRNGATQWYQNLVKNPAVTLDFGALVVRGDAHPVEDSAEAERVHELFHAKYWLARISFWFGAGFGSGKVVAVEPSDDRGGEAPRD